MSIRRVHWFLVFLLLFSPPISSLKRDARAQLPVGAWKENEELLLADPADPPGAVGALRRSVEPQPKEGPGCPLLNFCPTLPATSRPNGLAHINNNVFWMTDHRNALLYEFTSSVAAGCSFTGRTCSVPVGDPSELTFDGTWLYNYNFRTGMIYQINPQNCAYTSFPAPGDDLAEGLAWDGNLLWKGDSQYLYGFRPPPDLTIVRQCENPTDDSADGLTVCGNILYIHGYSGTIYAMDLATCDIQPLCDASIIGNGLTSGNDSFLMLENRLAVPSSRLEILGLTVGSETIRIRTGQVGGEPGMPPTMDNVGPVDDRFRCYTELGCNRPLTTLNFAAARSGTLAELIVPHPAPAWLPALSTDPDARWINHNHGAILSTGSGRPAQSVLYAYPFEVCQTGDLCGVVEVTWAVDDALGDADDSGVWINDIELNSSFVSSDGASIEHVASQYVPLNTGTNWLYVYQRDGGCSVSGLLLSATISVGACCFGELGGLKFHDLNGDGIHQFGTEPGLKGWTITYEGPVSGSAITDGSGFYSTGPIPCGDYLVQEILQPGWVVTTPPGGSAIVTVVSGVSTEQNFGNYMPTGACCLPDSCLILPPSECPGKGNYQGDGTVCDPDPCEPAVGACCFDDEGLDCSDPPTLTCGDQASGAIVSPGGDVDYYGCTGLYYGGSTEAVYKICMGAAGSLGVHMTYTHSGTADADLFLLGSCDPADCIGASLGTDGVEDVTVNVPAGTYFAVVDGWEGLADGTSHIVTVSCAMPCAIAGSGPLFENITHTTLGRAQLGALKESRAVSNVGPSGNTGVGALILGDNTNESLSGHIKSDMASATARTRWRGRSASSTCIILSAVACAKKDGSYQGDGTVCDPNPCSDGSSCGRATIYDNGHTNIYTESGNEFTDWSQADDFQVPSNTVISGAECDWFDTSKSVGWDGTIEWTIYVDGGGSPGVALASGAGQNIVTTGLGSASCWDWYNTCFDFGEAVALAAGQRYWISFHFTTSGCDERYGLYLAHSVAQTFDFSQESADCATGWAPAMKADCAFKLFRDDPTEAPGVPEVEVVGITRLHQNSPNPFSPRTVIRFSLARRAIIDLSIFDASGRKVRTLSNGLLGAGFHEVVWDGLNDAGDTVASGVFWSQLSADEYRSTKRIVLLR